MMLGLDAKVVATIRARRHERLSSMTRATAHAALDTFHAAHLACQAVGLQARAAAQRGDGGALSSLSPERDRLSRELDHARVALEEASRTPWKDEADGR